MEEIIRFVSLANSGRFSLLELCEDFGISRKTGYKHLARYETEGLSGLQPRSCRPKHCPHKTDEEVERLVIEERKAHPRWGPKKLRDVIEIKHGIESPPACSTLGAILHRHGLSQKRRRRPGVYHPTPSTLTQPEHPNHVWTVDFKGWFLLGNGQRCDPLTVCDRFSRYLIDCSAQPNQQHTTTLYNFKNMMRYHGLPEIIRVDNGTPFASWGLGRLSRLSVWWIEQGIEVEFTRPAHPQDNGSHERMHRDLKAETTLPPSPTLRAQQRRFDRWREEYNQERPHEALEMCRPAELYHPSDRRLNENDTALVSYPANYTTKKLSGTGMLLHEGRSYFVGEALADCLVGLHVNKDGKTELHFANSHLGYLVYDPGEQFRPPAYIAPPDSPVNKHQQRKSDH